MEEVRYDKLETYRKSSQFFMWLFLVSLVMGLALSFGMYHVGKSGNPYTSKSCFGVTRDIKAKGYDGKEFVIKKGEGLWIPSDSLVAVQIEGHTKLVRVDSITEVDGKELPSLSAAPPPVIEFGGDEPQPHKPTPQFEKVVEEINKGQLAQWRKQVNILSAWKEGDPTPITYWENPSPVSGWTFHEIRPWDGAVRVYWVKGDRPADDNVRPKLADLPPEAIKYKDSSEAPEPSDGQPFGKNAIVWRDMTVPGGYTWVQARFGYLRGAAKDDPRPPRETPDDFKKNDELEKAILEKYKPNKTTLNEYVRERAKYRLFGNMVIERLDPVWVKPARPVRIITH